MDTSSTKEPVPADFQTLEAAADFWDTHSIADYWDETREVQIQVRARRRHRVTLADEVWKLVSEEAAVRGVSAETLANVWLMERSQESSLTSSGA